MGERIKANSTYSPALPIKQLWVINVHLLKHHVLIIRDINFFDFDSVVNVFLDYLLFFIEYWWLIKMNFVVVFSLSQWLTDL